MNDKMTLRELLTRIGSTKGLKIPSGLHLRQSEEAIATYVAKDYFMAVYPSGFALVISGRRSTVVRADMCLGYTYFHDDSTPCGRRFTRPTHIKEDVFLDQPRTIRLMLTAEDQLEKNQDDRERKWHSEHPDIAEDKVWMLGGYDNPVEAEVFKRMHREKIMLLLTDKQREAFCLYFEQGYTQQQIAEKLGISRDSVADRLDAVIQKVRKHSVKNV